MKARTIRRTATLGVLLGTFFAVRPSAAAQVERPPTLDDRVEAQRAIEGVYWRHRIWPKENPGPKPPLSEVVSDAALRAKVDDYLRKSAALDQLFGEPVTRDRLQAELDRMARDTKDPQMLRELFRALGDDALLVAETLARQTLADRSIRARHGDDPGFDTWWAAARTGLRASGDPATASYALPAVEAPTCTSDTWNPTRLDELDVQSEHTAVWTGSEMIVWGGAINTFKPARYTPATDTWATVSTGANAPPQKDLHTAIWTGTRMIVWGGVSGAPFNVGGRYDPVTDTWLPTSTGAGCPSARYAHTAVWTGSSMIVWGGYDGNAPVSTGGRYDPASDTWTATSTGAGCPISRYSHTAVWTGALMIVWGGYAPGVTNTGGRYDPASDTWAATSFDNVPVSRAYHTAVWSGSWMIVWGGYTGTSFLNTGGRYNPSTDSWMATSIGANVPTPRDEHTAIWTGTEMIVWGGFTSPTGYRQDGARYDSFTNSWSPMSSGTNDPAPRGMHTAIWTGTEMVIWGGTNGSSKLNTGGRYRPASDAWLTTSTSVGVPAPRQGHTGVWTGAEMIVWGGANGTYLNTGGRYTPATDSWSLISMGASVPNARLGHTAVWTGTEMIVWGGWRGTGGSYENTGGRYNPGSDSWTATSTGTNCPAAREEHTAVWTGSQMIVWGGYNGVAVSTGGRYDPSIDSWSTVSTGANVPAARYGHVAVWTGSQMIVWGGVPGFLITGGRYTPASDTWLPTSTGAGVPTGSYQSTAIWTGSRMIVWGGYDGSHRNTGGRYDPASDTWAATSTGTNAPSPRRAHDAVWTGLEMIVWGGYDGVAYFDTGGRYDPSGDTWLTTSAAANVPAPRELHSGVWTGTEMIVWGGGNGSPLDSGGRYCGCESVTAYHRDADGDGYGAPGDSRSACTGVIPAGYVLDGSDCDDGNAQVHPGAPEINDGVDNQCPGDPGFGSIDETSPDLRYATPGDKTALTWTPQAGATRYDAARSPYPDFHAGCKITSTSSPALTDAATPPVGGAFYYLVRAASPWNGSWGKRSSGAERTVCPGCESSADQCDDGNPCTSQSCAGTACVVGSPSCDDGNPCTDDACSGGLGCTHTNNANVCDDGSSCTTGDVCQGGVCAGTFPVQANHPVISQIQVSGGTADDDFVELYNPTAAPVALAGLSLQYKTNTTMVWAVHTLGGGTVGAIPAHGWLLLATAAYDGAVPADETLPFALAAGSAQVMLASVTAPVSGCPGVGSGFSIDRVGWGSGSCVEGSAAPAPGANDSILRKPGGSCGNGTDTNANFGDFVSQSPSMPRNSHSPPQP